MRDETEVRKKAQRAQELADAEMRNQTQKDFLQTVADVLGWALDDDVDDPLMDSDPEIPYR